MNDKILILAAGNSSRLGENKQILKIKGVSLLNRCINVCNKTDLGEIFVVLGYNSTELQKTISHQNVQIIKNENWQKGMGESIATGIGNLDTNTKGVYIILPDQIKLEEKVLLNIQKLNQLHPSAIITSKYGDVFGAPTYFPSQFFDALRECAGLNGAKKVIQENISEVKFVEFVGGEIDIDKPEDLKLLD